MEQIEMVSVDQLVPSDHSYRKMLEIWSFRNANNYLVKLEKDNPHKGYGLLRLFKCLLLQFLEDHSDRELARFLQENNAAKYFCGFSLAERTPDYSVFSRVRARIGTKLLSKIFANLRDQLRSQGYMNEVFTCVDATHLIAKANLWQERDELIRQRDEKLSNVTLPQVAADFQARMGCKGKDKYWYGYKKHVSVDMQSGLINKVALTPANVIDSKGLKHVCPSQGAVIADKGYCDRHARQATQRRGCHLSAIKKGNMKGKNRDLDRWLSGLRSPYERVFSKDNKRVRYRGVAKNQFAEMFKAIAFNLKRLLVLSPPNLCLE